VIKEFALIVIVGTAILPGTWFRYGTVAAQDQDDEVVIGISINNPYNVPITFRVKKVNGGFDDRKLAPGAEKIYREYNQISIYSQNGHSVHYRLEKEGRYVFYWDASSQKWDLRKRR
jgi:hypothetical protein